MWCTTILIRRCLLKFFYDERKRNVAMEQDVQKGVEAFRECSGLLTRLEEFDISHMKISPMFQIGQADQVSEFDSTLKRELWFCAHHAIHHNAMILMIANLISDETERNMMLSSFPGDFGLAPATITALK
mmetsp:Transcript_32051/g.39464  ORF Transcript_32051/g.39464 Transcript_32051/m.39464 type:complete len:130 (-) Transcript_32051:444-833(-)